MEVEDYDFKSETSPDEQLWPVPYFRKHLEDLLLTPDGFYKVKQDVRTEKKFAPKR